MKIHEIFGHISTWCADNNVGLSLKKRKMIAAQIKARFDDSYLTITHGDPTGEQAVRNVMRAMFV